MLLKLKKDGTITATSLTSSREVVMNNLDIQNLMFSKFTIESKYDFESFFEMFKNYPFFQTLFPIMKDYVNEYELINTKKENDEEYFLVLTSVTTILNGLISHQILSEIYNSSDIFQENLNLAFMKLKEYLHYKITLNTLSLFESEQDIKNEYNEIETIQNPQIYLEIDVLESYDLITFIKAISSNITACGLTSERDKIIDGIKKEKDLIELEADRLAAKIMGELNG